MLAYFFTQSRHVDKDYIIKEFVLYKWMLLSLLKEKNVKLPKLLRDPEVSGLDKPIGARFVG